MHNNNNVLDNDIKIEEISTLYTFIIQDIKKYKIFNLKIWEWNVWV